MSNPFHLLLAFFIFGFPNLTMQPPAVERVIPAKLLPGRDLTISYEITIRSKRKSTGIGETYNGGVKTIFIKDGVARLRLVSLMRMQDIFLIKPSPANKLIVLVKESGKARYASYLTAPEWKQYNNKYEGITCRLQPDTAVILRQVCKKALVTLKDGKTITVYYSEQDRKPEFSLLEPAFACIPGLVLKYEYKSKKGSVSYTATSISNDPIDPAALAVPQKGFTDRKYNAPAK